MSVVKTMNYKRLALYSRVHGDWKGFYSLLIRMRAPSYVRTIV